MTPVRFYPTFTPVLNTVHFDYAEFSDQELRK